MNRHVKQALGFVFLKGAVNSRNLTSIGLVALFFGIYVASGGKVAALPNIQSGGGFGTTQGTSVNIQQEAKTQEQQSQKLFAAEEKVVNTQEDLFQENKADKEEEDRLDDILNRLGGMENDG